ncbi:Sec1 family domain-containing protein MIP3 [Zea mays]|nr:Sec1 family domain-containing protein MIP3 [Zea mays]
MTKWARVFVLPSEGIIADSSLSNHHEDSLGSGLPSISTGKPFDSDEVPPGVTLTAQFLYHLANKMDLKLDIFSLGDTSKHHGFWNQVVKAAFWILNQLFLERFADHQQDRNLLMFLQQMVKQQAPRSRAHLAHALLMRSLNKIAMLLKDSRWSQELFLNICQNLL